MAKFSAQPSHTTAPADTDLLLIDVDLGGSVYETHKIEHGVIRKSYTQKMRGTISNPQAVYAQRAQVPLFRADAALTITRINVTNSVSDHETAGDLKWADDIFTGGFANATVIDVCDTTSGVFTATTGFDDATIASGKEVYFQFDSSPHTDIKDIRLEVWFTYD